MMGDLRVEAVTRTMESPLGNRSQSVPKWKLPTGEPYAGKPPVRFGGRGGESLPYPYRPWTVTSRLCKCLIQPTCQPLVSCARLQGLLSWLPVCHPWTLDFGIPAEMTGLQHLCITVRAGTWEPAAKSSAFSSVSQHSAENRSTITPSLLKILVREFASAGSSL